MTATEKFNLMQKMNKVIVDLQAMNLKKTGRNQSEKRSFNYYELGDFLPYLNELCAQHGIYKQVWFTNKYAYLRLTNTEDQNDRLLYTSPMRDASMPMSQPIQLLGAEQTYQRRYLLMNAFEIVENDMVDAQPLEKNQSKPVADATASGVVPGTKPATPAPATTADGQKTFPGATVKPGPAEPPAAPAGGAPFLAQKRITKPQQNRLYAKSGGDKDIILALLTAKALASIEEVPMGKVYEDLCKQAEKMAANKQVTIAPAPPAQPKPEPQEPEITDDDIPF